MTTKKTVTAIARSVVAEHEESERQAAEQLVEALGNYRALVGELAKLAPEKRPEELLFAGRILAGRLGYSVDDDLRHLDAIREADELEQERGDLDAAMRSLDAELNGAGQAWEQFEARQAKERHDMEWHYRHVGDEIRRLSSIASSRRAAVAAIKHLEGVK